MRKVISLLLMSVMLVSSLGEVALAATTKSSTIKAKQSQLNVLKSQIYNLKQKKNQKKNAKYGVINKMNNIEDNISYLQGEISNLNGGIESTSANIAKTSRNLDAKKIQLSKKKSTFNKRLRAMYKNGNVGFLQVLLGSKDFSELLTRTDMVQRIYSQDKKLIKEITAETKAIERQKANLISYQAQLRNMSAEKASKQMELNSNLSALDAEKRRLSKDIAAIEAREAQLYEEANQITALIRSLQSTKTKYTGGRMGWPAPGYYTITSTFGYRTLRGSKDYHTGLDIAVKYGAKIVAAQGGTVIYSGWRGPYGNAVIIDHGGGIATLYAHNSSLTVSVGQKVARGQQIARGGSTGNSTGNHCHFEVRVNGKYVNPAGWVK